jgi:heat shock protein HslJ
MQAGRWILSGLLIALLSAGCVAPTGEQGGSEGMEKTLYVGPELVDCVGVVPMKCMQVKERPEDEWQLFYSAIEGFSYEPGYTYELRVREEPVENPPADGSALNWTLIEVTSKTASAPGEQAHALAGSSWTLTAFGDGTAVSAARPATLIFDAAGARAAGTGGVNRYNGSVTVAGDTITFGPAASTRMAGPPEEARQEDAFFKALQTVASYEVAGDTLTLRDAGDKDVLVFAKG